MDKAPKEIAMDIAKRLTAMRLQNAWTREDLANRTGVNIYTLKHFERTGQISLERLIRLCGALEILPDFQRAFKPRQRVDVDDWAVSQQKMRKRGRRKVKKAVTTEATTTETTTDTVAETTDA